MIKITKKIGIAEWESSNDFFLFPGGEVGVKVEHVASGCTCLLIDARIRNSNDLVELLLVNDAIRRQGYCGPIDLFLPYVPYARQDRVCNPGEPLSLKVFCDLINSAKFDNVIIVDPHSDVCSALLDRVSVIEQLKIVREFPDLCKRIEEGMFVISPDAGANKKAFKIAKHLNAKNFVRCDKVRDLQTGDIKETIVYHEDFNQSDVCIFDDICDGGRTFIEIAAQLKKKNCGKVVLFVTHGIFSKGLCALYDNGIDEIYTTDSWGTPVGYLPEAPKLNIKKLSTIY
jgi:ribose-phosphate pyrophosphokinase